MFRRALFVIMSTFCLMMTAAVAQEIEGNPEGHPGHHQHDLWHGDFYSKLFTPESKVSCCNLADCRPTSGRMVKDHYEVKVNGSWIPVLASKVVKISAPDGGFHVCAPTPLFSGKPEHIYCVVLPPES